MAFICYFFFTENMHKQFNLMEQLLNEKDSELKSKIERIKREEVIIQMFSPKPEKWVENVQNTFMKTLK